MTGVFDPQEHPSVIELSSHGIFVIFLMESFGCEKYPPNHPSIFKIQTYLLNSFQTSLISCIKSLFEKSVSLKNIPLRVLAKQRNHYHLHIVRSSHLGCLGRCQWIEPASRSKLSFKAESKTNMKTPRIDGLLGGGNSNIFDFHPYLGKWSNLTNIFQLGWNHQLDCRWFSFSFVDDLRFHVSFLGWP